MTPQQALREARRRWGKVGHVRMERAEGPTRCSVGKIVLGLMFGVEGQGPTFAAAYRDLDTKHERSQLWQEAKGQPCPDCSRTMQAEAVAERVLNRSERAELKRLRAELKLHKFSSDEKQRVAVAINQILYPHRPVVVERAGVFVAVCKQCVTKEDQPC